MRSGDAVDAWCGARRDHHNNSSRSSTDSSRRVACLTSDVLQHVFAYVDVSHLLRDVVCVCRRWRDVGECDVHAWRLRWQQYLTAVFADHGLVQRIRVMPHTSSSDNKTQQTAAWYVARGAAAAAPLPAVTHAWPRPLALARIDVTVVDDGASDGSDARDVHVLLARAAHDIVAQSYEHAAPTRRCRCAVSLSSSSSSLQPQQRVLLSRAQRHWRVVQCALLRQPREARVLAHMYARTLHTLAHTTAAAAAATDERTDNESSDSSDNKHEAARAAWPCSVEVRVGAGVCDDAGDDGSSSSAAVVQARVASRLLSLLRHSLSFSWRACFIDQFMTPHATPRHGAGAEGAYNVSVYHARNDNNSSSSSSSEVASAATTMASRSTAPFASPIADAEVFALCVRLRQLRAWRYTTRHAQRHGSSSNDDDDDDVKDMLQRHCRVRTTREVGDTTTTTTDDDNDDDDDALVFAYPLHHVVCYTHLLLHTELTRVQHNCWPNEVKYAVYGRLVSPAGDVVETRFFYSYYDMAYPRMYATMLFSRSALPYAQLARELRVRAQRGDDATVKPYSSNSSNSSCSNDDDDDDRTTRRRAAAAAAGAGARHACIAPLHAPMELFSVGFGRVEVDKAPTVSAAALCALRDALGLPPSCALALVWNAALHAGGIAVGVLRHHRDTLCELYGDGAFTAAVAKACGARACYGVLHKNSSNNSDKRDADAAANAA